MTREDEDRLEQNMEDRNESIRSLGEDGLYEEFDKAVEETIEKAPNGRDLVHCKLVGEDGNAFAILGRIEREMHRARWTKEEIDVFQKEATSGDYDHLLQTAIRYTTDEETEESEGD